jgi:lipopolysaccharide transport system permease protein
VSAVVPRPRPPATVIEPPAGFVPLKWRQLWSYRDLFRFLVSRDIKLRWAQTRMGAVWVVLQPLALLGVYTLVFSRVGNKGVEAPYPLFALAGLTAWQFTSRSLLQGSESLVSQLNVIKRTSCPRILFPLAAIASCGIDFGITIGLYFVLAFAYGWTPTWHVVFVLPLLLVAFGLALGFALLLAPVHARYRDVGRLLPFVVQLWFFLSPVAYVLPRIGGQTHVVEMLNPMVGIVSGFRWALLGMHPELRQLGIAVGLSMLVVVLGVVHFNRAQQTIADHL